MKESDEPLRDGHPEHGIRLPQTRICVRGKGPAATAPNLSAWQQSSCHSV